MALLNISTFLNFILLWITRLIDWLFDWLFVFKILERNFNKIHNIQITILHIGAYH